MNRDDLIAAMRATAAEKPRPVEVKNWGTVYVKAVTVAEADAEVDDDEKDGKRTRLARGAARVICDAEGNRLFDPASADDVALLAAQPWSMLRKLLAESDAGN